MKHSSRSGDGEAPRDARMDAVGELLKRISHDYNNLFGIVIATLGILEEDIDEHPEIAQLKPLIADALSASREGTELMGRLLACTGHHSLDPESVDLASALNAMEARIRDTLDPGIRLEVSVAPQLPGAFVDPGAFEGAVQNLVDNAREAMPSGGTLTLFAGWLDGAPADGGASQSARYLEVGVADTGEGIDPALSERVLEPFVTSKEPRKTRGFGLSLCYGFARQSGGWLTLDSRPGEGTRVILALPAADGTGP